jgi:hypothetical protein
MSYLVSGRAHIRRDLAIQRRPDQRLTALKAKDGHERAKARSLALTE